MKLQLKHLQHEMKLFPESCETKKKPYMGYWNPEYANCSVPVCPEGYYGPNCSWMVNGSRKYLLLFMIFGYKS